MVDESPSLTTFKRPGDFKICQQNFETQGYSL
jgi:hypothetical protein